jgi:hypothetical protein
MPMSCAVALLTNALSQNLGEKQEMTFNFLFVELLVKRKQKIQAKVPASGTDVLAALVKAE